MCTKQIAFCVAEHRPGWSPCIAQGGPVSPSQRIQFDGFDTSHRLSGDSSQLVLNAGMTQEVVVSKGSGGADMLSGGLATNVIPKSGGNSFSGSFSTFYADEGLVSSNLPDELKAIGVGSQDLRKTWDRRNHVRVRVPEAQLRSRDDRAYECQRGVQIPRVIIVTRAG